MITDGGSSPAPPSLPWGEIDTVLLDLDGTLLDLAYDTHFWTHEVPAAWAAPRGLTLEQAQAQLRGRFQAVAGTLPWYCIEHWSRELGLDIVALKRASAHRIGWLPGARAFLLRLRALGKRVVLLTNSHPTTLSIKDERTQVLQHFDAAFSSHRFGVPKEDPRFWIELARRERFDAARSLFVDDSEAVLHAARAAGIGRIYAVRRPDSRAAARSPQGFDCIDGVAELL